MDVLYVYMWGWGKLGEVLRENREVMKRREGGQTESVPE